MNQPTETERKELVTSFWKKVVQLFFIVLLASITWYINSLRTNFAEDIAHKLMSRNSDISIKKIDMKGENAYINLEITNNTSLDFADLEIQINSSYCSLIGKLTTMTDIPFLHFNVWNKEGVFVFSRVVSPDKCV